MKKAICILGLAALGVAPMQAQSLGQSFGNLMKSAAQAAYDYTTKLDSQTMDLRVDNS